MTNTNNKERDAHFPQSVFFTSRREFYSDSDSQDKDVSPPLELNVSGELPSDIYGHLLMVAPVGLEDDRPDKGLIRSTEDGTPLFNGDGMVYRLDFDEANSGKVKLSSRIAKTPCFYCDRALEGKDEKIKDDSSIPDFINLGLARLSINLGFRNQVNTALGFRNQVNTAIIPMKFSEEEEYRLMMTWDAGRPYEIDPKTLKVITAVGTNEEWDEQIDLQQILEVVNTASHPAFDPNTKGGELFTVSFQKSLQTWLELINKYRDKDIGEDDIRSKLNHIQQTIQHLESKTHERYNRLASQSLVNNLTTNRQPIAELNELPGFYRKIIIDFEAQLKEIGFEAIEFILNLFLDFSLVDRVNWIFKLLEEVLIDMDDRVLLIRWNGKTKGLKTWKVVCEDKTSIKIPNSMHQIAATKDYLVLADTVFKVGPEQLLPNLFPERLPNLFGKIENPLNGALREINEHLRDFFSYPQANQTDLYIVRRADLDPEQEEVVAKHVVIPMPFPHFIADYANPNQQITLHVAHNTGWDASSWVRPYDDLATGGKINSEEPTFGMTSGSTDINYFASYIIDLQNWDNPQVYLKGDKLISDPKLTWMSAIATYYQAEGINLPKKFKNIFWVSWGCWNDLLTDYVVKLYNNKDNYPGRKIPVDELVKITRQGVPANLCRVDVEKGEIVDYHQFEPNVFANSPQFVPRKQSNKTVDESIDESIDGYIVCVVNTGDDKKGASEFHIFDADKLKDGAICKLSHEDLKLGMTLHSAWCPKIDKRVSDYHVDARTDYPVEEQLNPIASFFQKIIQTYFPDGMR